MAATHISFYQPAQAAITALALFFIGVAISPAQAQSVPQGSYLSSCTAVRMDGRTLRATCRAGSGQQVPNELHEADNCRNDIVNENGRLVCKLGTQPPRGAAPGPGRAQQPEQPNGRNPQPSFGGGGGPGREYSERCEQLRVRYRELRDRLNFTYEPYERERLERRVGETRGEYRSSCG